tara:strand:- start:2569 stop:3264 length:696 start_codon:yes stop_codon:yes gene_type:complete
MRFAIILIFFLCYFLIPTTSIQAGQCLKYPDLNQSTAVFQNIKRNFVQALKEAGICIEIVNAPFKRATRDIKSGKLDGLILRARAYQKFAGDYLHMIEEPLTNGSGLLISFDPKVTSLQSLAGKSIAINEGARWQMKLVRGRKNILNVPKFDSQVRMLKHGRVAAILMSSTIVSNFPNEFKGATMTKLVDLSGYPWIRTGLKHRSAEIAQAIRAYRARGHAFTDPLHAKIN